MDGEKRAAGPDGQAEDAPSETREAPRAPNEAGRPALAQRPPAPLAEPGGGASAGPTIGLVLGAGAARGWSHLGVIEGLQAIGVRPSIVVGCSSGSVVAAAYAAGRAEALAEFATSLTWRGVLGYFDFSWRGGGLIEGRWLNDYFREAIGDHRIEDLPIAFGSVATELSSGRETWFTRGSLSDAVRASIALPGLITPIAIEGRWMVDGALVNPIPVSLCRALGAEVILGVSMSGDLVTLGRSPLALAARADAAEPEQVDAAIEAAALKTPTSAAEKQSSWLAWLTGYGGGDWASYWAGASAAAHHPEMAPPPALPKGRPGYFDVLGQSFFSVQNFVSRVRLAADPVDVLIVPDVEGLGIMDFHRGAEAIEAGRAAVAAKADLIRARCLPGSESAGP